MSDSVNALFKYLEPNYRGSKDDISKYLDIIGNCFLSNDIGTYSSLKDFLNKQYDGNNSNEIYNRLTYKLVSSTRKESNILPLQIDIILKLCLKCHSSIIEIQRFHLSNIFYNYRINGNFRNASDEQGQNLLELACKYDCLEQQIITLFGSWVKLNDFMKSSNYPFFNTFPRAFIIYIEALHSEFSSPNQEVIQKVFSFAFNNPEIRKIIQLDHLVFHVDEYPPIEDSIKIPLVEFLEREMIKKYPKSDQRNYVAEFFVRIIGLLKLKNSAKIACAFLKLVKEAHQLKDYEDYVQYIVVEEEDSLESALITLFKLHNNSNDNVDSDLYLDLIKKFHIVFPVKTDQYIAKNGLKSRRSHSTNIIINNSDQFESAIQSFKARKDTHLTIDRLFSTLPHYGGILSKSAHNELQKIIKEYQNNLTLAKYDAYYCWRFMQGISLDVCILDGSEIDPINFLKDSPQEFVDCLHESKIVPNSVITKIINTILGRIKEKNLVYAALINLMKMGLDESGSEDPAKSWLLLEPILPDCCEMIYFSDSMHVLLELMKGGIFEASLAALKLAELKKYEILNITADLNGFAAIAFSVENMQDNILHIFNMYCDAIIEAKGNGEALVSAILRQYGVPDSLSEDAAYLPEIREAASIIVAMCDDPDIQKSMPFKETSILELLDNDAFKGAFSFRISSSEETAYYQAFAFEELNDDLAYVLDGCRRSIAEAENKISEFDDTIDLVINNCICFISDNGFDDIPDIFGAYNLYGILYKNEALVKVHNHWFSVNSHHEIKYFDLNKVSAAFYTQDESYSEVNPLFFTNNARDFLEKFDFL